MIGNLTKLRASCAGNLPLGVALALLAGCGLPDVAPIDIPPAVAAALPPDIDRREVNKDPDGCYFYTYAADLFVVRDADGAPICLP